MDTRQTGRKRNYAEGYHGKERKRGDVKSAVEQVQRPPKPTRQARPVPDDEEE